MASDDELTTLVEMLREAEGTGCCKVASSLRTAWVLKCSCPLCCADAIDGLRAELAERTRERDAMSAMLDRIAAIDGVEFDSRQEECIADGVEGMADCLIGTERELTAERAELAEAKQGRDRQREIASGYYDEAKKALDERNAEREAKERAKEACRVLAQAGVNEKSRADAAERKLADVLRRVREFVSKILAEPTVERQVRAMIPEAFEPQGEGDDNDDR